MKKLLLLITVCSLGVRAWAGPEFEKGWQTGWDQGYKQVRGHYGLVPFPPMTPVLPPLNGDNYLEGYNIGFAAGMKAAGN